MIEATCTACGTVNRIADADVPVGAKFVNCASCKSRVAIPASTKSAATKLGGPSTIADFADLPAPRPKQSALGGESAKPAPRSGLAAAADAPVEPELPVPRTGAVKKPAPASPLDLDDLLATPDADLPAPRVKSELKPPPGGGRAMTDLPVPGIADTAPLADLPTPKPKSPVELADLPAPRPKAPPIPKIAPPSLPKPPVLGDLPAPKSDASATKPSDSAARPVGPFADLPAPKPAPVKPAPPLDLPMPKPGGVVDLPMPKGVQDLPQPKPGADLPAPKGFFDDLPQPARQQPAAKPDLPAPKGFFDDLPQPAKPQPPSTPDDVPAPKGFFEDLPARSSKASSVPEVPAPKGFFDDLPGKPIAPPKNEVAPKGFFDDLPGKPTAPPKNEVAPKGFFDDQAKPAGGAMSLDLEPREDSQAAIELQLEEDSAPNTPRAKPPTAAPLPAAGPSSSFDDLDLSSPSPVSFAKKPAGGAPPGPMPKVATITPTSAAAAAAVARPSGASLPPVNKSGELALDLEEPRKGPGPSVSQKLGPKERAERKANDAVTKDKASRRKKIAGIALVGVLALGGGGFYMYQRHAKAQAHEDAVNEQLSSARRAIAGAQWQKAAMAANSTLELDKTNAEALGIRGEALFALGIVEGNQGRIGQARKMIATALEANKQHPALERAKALSPLAANQPDKALPLLAKLATAAPKDASLQLYLGWALAAQGDGEKAIKAFDAAEAGAATKPHALLARARAKQSKGDIEGARADYGAVLGVQKDHVGAQVGLASTLPAAKAQQQESDLLAILALKDVEKREPRASTYAWVLAADVARRGGRLDVARERYRKALAITAGDVDALTGLAETELRDGKPDVASEQITKALQTAPNEVRPQLVAAEIAIAQKSYDDAAKRIDALAKRTPPPPVVDQARIKLLSAMLFEAQGKEQDAIDAYEEAAKLAGELDLTPTLFGAARINAFAAKAEAANDPARASELRKRADAMLGGLAAAAEKDGQLALTLGMAYLMANDAAKAEVWLRKAVEMQPKNVDALYQLAKSLMKLGKEPEAIANLRTAIELDPMRTEIGIELARTYEAAGRTADAEKLYDKLLLAAKDPPLELRVRAGRFFARSGQLEKAGEQGAKILEQQDDHPAGLYLKGEGLFAAKKYDAARKLFVQASDADPEAQYLDARGRAGEAWATESGNSAYQEDALRSYKMAVEKDPTIFTSWLGMGRLYVERKEDRPALEPLQRAWSLEQTPEVARLMGIAVKRLNQQPKVAADWLEQSLQQEPNADALYELAMLYVDERVNDPKGAIRSLERATKMAEDAEKAGEKVPAWYMDALYSLGDFKRNEQDLRGAKAAWTKWLGRNPPTGKGRYTDVQTWLSTTGRNL